MVTPPALSAAIPVGATIVICLCVRAARFLRKVVFPVPAFPVRKICLEVLLTRPEARLKMVFELSVLNMCQLSKLVYWNCWHGWVFNKLSGYFNQDFMVVFFYIREKTLDLSDGLGYLSRRSCKPEISRRYLQTALIPINVEQNDQHQISTPLKTFGLLIA